MELQTFDRENSARIKAVENSFGTSGKPLSKPGRVLLGKGHLMKQCRRKPQMKAFFLFNDLLIYGSIILNKHWLKKQKIIPLEDIQLEDMEDGEDMKNQWLIRTPKKSFFVSATSIEEKRAWIEHIENYRSILLQDGSHQPNPSFAVTWIPDRVSKKCMRCLENFTPTNRRHHCRKCGFLVCDKCSKYQALIDNIDAKKEVRVCKNCYSQSKECEISRYRGDSTGRNSFEEEGLAASSDGNWQNGIYTVWLEN